MSLQRMCWRGVLVLAVMMIWGTGAFGLDGRSIARLKRAGVGDQTIERMVAERTVETAAFSVDEIIAMKAAGIGEETLQAVIGEGSFLKDREPLVYGKDLRSLRLATAADIIELKRAGVSDDVLRAVIAVSRADAETDRREVLQQLAEMGIWVDLPRGGSAAPGRNH